MAHLALWSFLLLAGTQLALGRPQGSDSPPELILKPGCSESAMFRCVSPVISFVMSADGQRLMKIRKSGAIQQPDFEKACRLAGTTAGCMNTWIKKCVPEDAGHDLHILGQGTVDLLNVCNEPTSFDEFKKFASCAEKMNTTMKSCGEELRAKMPKTSGEFNHETPKRILSRQNLQRDFCCSIQKYNDCYRPNMQNVCGSDGVAVTTKLHNRILSSYKCTDDVLSFCANSIANAA
ncbi:hypothetical protein RvY_05240 [Ramazzottius varieornatus]|uniref:DUF19 domain-containing protein n=1 Tax=Ramazzottius varieornatus TaxID=947166 RepID=A0A1D1UUE4_RAMVA|nr:hypothetical protein RvY_05240 [Ramazzottius varieornatus]